MENIAIDWLFVNWPTLGLCTITGIVVWYAAKFFYKRFEKTEECVKSLPCSAHEENLKQVEKNLTERIEERVKSLPCKEHEETFKQISSNLSKIITILTSAFSVKCSPRQLNEKGKELYLACGGKELLEKNSDMLLEKISDNNPKTAFDVEEKAYEVLSLSQDMDIFNSVKQWIYNSSNWEIDTPDGPKQHSITIADVCFVISLPLRDLYLEKHSEIIPEG